MSHTLSKFLYSFEIRRALKFAGEKMVSALPDKISNQVSNPITGFDR
jgi:hypothetical protein